MHPVTGELHYLRRCRGERAKLLAELHRVASAVLLAGHSSAALQAVVQLGAPCALQLLQAVVQLGAPGALQLLQAVVQLGAPCALQLLQAVVQLGAPGALQLLWA